MEESVMKRLLPVLLAAVLLIPAVQAAPAGPDVSAQSCILMEKETGSILCEQNAHEKLEPASVTKVMTMLLILEALDTGRITGEDPVVVSAFAADTAVTAFAAGMGGSQVYLKEGEQMSVHEMLKCIAVSSANDAAVAMAEHLAGSEAAFVEKMNQRARELGMEDTHFANCTGLPVDDHYTSAYDIALMSRELILHHPDIRTYTTIWMDSVRNGAFGLSNTNRLIRFYNGATGLKTGFTDSAQYCLSATAERDGMELIAVVMKAPTSDDRFESAKALLDYGFANYTLKTVYPDQALPPIEVLLGTVDHVQPQLARDCRLLVSKDSAGQITTEITLAQDVEAPVEAGQRLGQMVVTSDGQVLDTIPIVAAQEVPRLTFPGIFGRMLHRILMAG